MSDRGSAYAPPRETDPDSLPNPRVVSSLEDARAGDVVYLDSKGRVRSRAWARAWRAVYTVVVLAMTTAAAFLAWLLLADRDDPLAILPLLAIPIAVGLAVRAVLRSRRLARGMALLSANRIDDAVRVLTPIADARPHRERAYAALYLGSALNRLGWHEEALTRCQQALRDFGRSSWVRPSPVQVALAKLAEIEVLTTLGRLDDASRKLAEVTKVPAGEYLLAQHWAAELYLAFARDSLEIPIDELQKRVEVARRFHSFTGLGATVAWACAKAGLEIDARELVALTKERVRERPIDRAMPALWAWVVAQA